MCLIIEAHDCTVTPVTLLIDKYENPNYSGLAILVVKADNMNLVSVLTIDLEECKEGCALVDVHGVPWSEKFIKDNNLGTPTGRTIWSRSKDYPEYRFDMSEILKYVEV